MRGWINAGRSYIPPVGIGEVMRAIGVGEVTATASDRFKVGEIVMGLTGVQTDATVAAKDFNKIEPSLAPPSTFLGGLGMPGMTAYFGLLEVGKPEAGQTVVVSAAAGAVGAVVGQIAKIKGCRVVGLAGGPDKCRYVVEELGRLRRVRLPEAVPGRDHGDGGLDDGRSDQVQGACGRRHREFP
jgi:NADPH-dependent curcumin reductase CurA